MLGLVLGSGAEGLDAGGAHAIARHADGDGYVLPHLIDHAANMARLRGAGCDRVLGVSSVGALRAELAPGTVLCPHDFVALGTPRESAFADARAHRVAGFDAGWRGRVVTAFSAACDLLASGVYWQVRGPRLETAAEVGLIAQHADVVGMTVASECVAACEAGLAYAAICMVDNLANGVGGEELTLEDVESGQRRNRERLSAALQAALPALI